MGRKELRQAKKTVKKQYSKNTAKMILGEDQVINIEVERRVNEITYALGELFCQVLRDHGIKEDKVNSISDEILKRAKIGHFELNKK